MRKFVFLMVSVGLAASLYGCKKGEAEPTVPTTSAPEGPVSKEPNYKPFGALKEVKFEISLPFFAGTVVRNDVRCFVRVPDVEPTAADDRLPGYIEQNIDDVTATIMDWVLQDLKPDLVSSEITKNWKVSFEDLVSKELDAEQLRFAEDPECFTNGGWLPDNHHLITTVFGAKKILFESSEPLTDDIRKSIKSAAAAKDIEMNVESLGDDPQNPTPVTQWELTFKKAIYFGAREIPDRMWRKESNKYDCELIFVKDAKNQTLRPECVEYRESTFSLSHVKGAKPISVTINTKGKKKIVELNWDEVIQLRVNDRINLWLQANQVEVGTRLRINSVVLNPEPIPGQESEDENEMVADEASAAAGQESGYTPSSNSDNAVDQYLAN
ncbi:MAG: hypothetical protein JXX29_03810 [Deltaproteobacteria bacterium]|nr:hypothetical protein [Deltaproteobacteria bacterium]MBN2670769.1 hypothetical protein [Deltaproteobacteria bacterium]